MSELILPEHVRKYAPWSVSKAGVIEHCSLQFSYKYGPEKIKELEQFQSATIGVAVHKALELALDGHPLKTAFMHAEDQGLTVNETEQLKTFWDQVDRFVKRMTSFQKKYGVTPHNRFIERRWAIRSDFTYCEFFDKGDNLFRGVVDFAMITASNDMVIIDHKSGKPSEISKYDNQFKSYCLMALAKFPYLRQVQTAINFTQNDTLVWNKPVAAAQIIEEYRPWLIEYLTKSCEKLLEPVKATKGWYCDWCGYKSICPAWGGTGRVPEENHQ